MTTKKENYALEFMYVGITVLIFVLILMMSKWIWDTQNSQYRMEKNMKDMIATINEMKSVTDKDSSDIVTTNSNVESIKEQNGATARTLEQISNQLEYRRQDIQDLKCKIMYGNKYSRSDSNYKCEKVQYKD